jgi:hypothetical protein
MVVLGTPAAFQGLEVTSGMEAVIENALARYPERIVRLLDDPSGRTPIGASARWFAKRYDYRIAYRAYSGC